MVTSHTRIIMGMPITLQLPGTTPLSVIESAFNRFIEIDSQYSPYIPSSEVSNIGSGAVALADASEELHSILDLAQDAKTKTNLYFDPFHKEVFDPSGIVKGWAIAEVVAILRQAGIEYFIVDAGGDMYCAGKNESNVPWKIGIRAPLEPSKVVKQLALSNMAIATSGTSERGQHIYNPKTDEPIVDLLSVSVIGLDIIWADVYATAAFAMGRAGIEWLEMMPDYEGFAILPDMTGISTSGMARFLA